MGIHEEPESQDFYALSAGFIGIEAAIAFRDFTVNSDRRITGQEILNDFQKSKKKIAKLGSERLNIALDKVAAYVNEELTTLTDQQGKNLSDFVEMLPPELRISAFSKLTSKGLERLEMAKQVHKYCSKHILEVFQDKSGAVSLGAMPDASKKSSKK